MSKSDINTPGAITVIISTIILLPTIIIFSYLLWQRRKVAKNISERNPLLVGFTNLIFAGWCLALNSFILIFFKAIQRSMQSIWPCAITLWMGYIGIIIICNMFLWRCWLLYHSFKLQKNLQDNKDKGASALKNDWFFTHKHYLKTSYLLPRNIILGIILLLPCFIITLTDDELISSYGDGCNRGVADWILLSYCIIYVVIFLFFSWQFRQVVESFNIKNELRNVGIAGAITIFLWVLFNNISALNPINIIFPISTITLFIGIAVIFIITTLIPLYESYHPSSLKADTENLLNPHNPKKMNVLGISARVGVPLTARGMPRRNLAYSPQQNDHSPYLNVKTPNKFNLASIQERDSERNVELTPISINLGNAEKKESEKKPETFTLTSISDTDGEDDNTSCSEVSDDCTKDSKDTPSFTIPTIDVRLESNFSLPPPPSEDPPDSIVKSDSIARSDDDPEVSLCSLLQLPEGNRSFKAFLASEFCVEMILFFDDVNNYHELCLDDPEVQGPSLRRMHEIFETYIGEDAPAAINVSDSIVIETTENVQDILNEATQQLSIDEIDVYQDKKHKVFDNCWDQVFFSMEDDCFPRYLRSNHYQQLLSSINERDMGTLQNRT